MKKLLTILLLTMAIPAFAQHRHHGHHHNFRYHGHGSWGWMAPAVIGGLIVYGATRPDPIVIQQPPIIVSPNDTVIIDGVTYKKQLVQINGIWQEVLVRI